MRKYINKIAIEGELINNPTVQSPISPHGSLNVIRVNPKLSRGISYVIKESQIRMQPIKALLADIKPRNTQYILG